MIEFVDSIVLWTSHYQESIDFYRMLGLPLEDEEHEKGPVHIACEIGPLHFALYEVNDGVHPPRGGGGHVQIGFRVDSADVIHQRLLETGTPVVIPPQNVPWGRR
ncbi:MAG: VOC family protein, partial [Planctomycetota bacterium]|nr:VOC family protein [Planctomycetota bacterium]